jgi:antitoxin (DNA-binding transcriptional repressor) of toxin-antitoxin stability system
MNTVSHRDFFRRPELASALKPGEALLVTKDGAPSFVAVPPKPPRRLTTREIAAQAARGKSFDGVEFLRNQRA